MKSLRYGGKSLYEFFLTVNNTRKATLVFEKIFERAGKPNMERRYDFAADAFNNYHNSRSNKYWGDRYG